MFLAVELYIVFRDLQREWHCLSAYGYICIVLALGDGKPKTFFRPLDENNTEGNKVWAFMLITSTSFISWIMAKSVQVRGHGAVV